MGIVFVGTGFESKMQMGLLVILTVSLINFVVGTFMPISETNVNRGVVGYSCTVFLKKCMS